MAVDFNAAREAAEAALPDPGAGADGAPLMAHAVPVSNGAPDFGAAPGSARNFAQSLGFKAEAGSVLAAPSAEGDPPLLLLGLGGGALADHAAVLATKAPKGASIAFTEATQAAAGPDGLRRAALSVALGGYRYDRFKQSSQRTPRLIWPEAAGDPAETRALAAGMFFARDLVNAPTNALGPAELAEAARSLAETYGAAFSVTEGDALLAAGMPMIHAVGRAGPQPPRLIELTWRPADRAADGLMSLALVGKGVCFDTGGLDIKPRAGMRLMKKDMGGAAACLGLAAVIMALNWPVALRVLIPAVENSISSNSFRPGDVLSSRRGLSVEIGDTDAEGRLILADALTLADEASPDLMIDLATLTGAARVALGPDIAPFYTDDDALAADLAAASAASGEPLWRMPLHRGYDKDLASPVADIGNVSAGGFAGSITAALFLRRFVRDASAWAHFDIFCWNPKSRPGRPEGGEATSVRALAAYLSARLARSGPGAA